jgi:hypothetical protein
MKTNNNSRISGRDIAVLSGLLMVVSMIILAACATTGMDRSADASMSMQAVDKDIRTTLLQVDVTNASLENLIKPGQPDVEKALDKYSDNVEEMEKRGEVLIKHVNEMSARRMDYFAEWKKQGETYDNPEIRQLSEQRRADLTEIFARIPSASVGIKGAFSNYMSDIKEIDQYLTNDLTPTGIESITPTARKTIQDGENLKEAVKPVVIAIDRAKDAMSQGGAR